MYTCRTSRVANPAKNDAVRGGLSSKETYKDDFVPLATSSLITVAYKLLLYRSVGFMLGKRCKERSSLPGCSSVYSHFQKTPQLARGKRKTILIVDIHDVSVASDAILSTGGKVGHHLHINVCKVGVVHAKNVLRM